MLELPRIKRSAHDDDLQVLSVFNNLLKPNCLRLLLKRIAYLDQPHEDVGGERPFVGLIENYNGVVVEQRAIHGLSQQHTVGAVLEDGAVADAVLETNRVTDFLSQLNRGVR